MKIVLDKKWEYPSTLSRSSQALWKHMVLVCRHIGLYSVDCGQNNERWIGTVWLAPGLERRGPQRTSVKEARRDAERLAVELLHDIRDGTKKLMETYGIGEDD
jgi:hypothetical protein